MNRIDSFIELMDDAIETSEYQGEALVERIVPNHLPTCQHVWSNSRTQPIRCLLCGYSDKLKVVRS